MHHNLLNLKQRSLGFRELKQSRMLSTKQRLKLQSICNRITEALEVELDEMIWVSKLAKANGSAGEMLRKARRTAAKPTMQPGNFDDFLNQMDIGFVDPCNHRNNFQGVDDITEFFSQDKPDDWRQRD